LSELDRDFSPQRYLTGQQSNPLASSRDDVALPKIKLEFWRDLLW
jgi:hypothetical protein